MQCELFIAICEALLIPRLTQYVKLLTLVSEHYCRYSPSQTLQFVNPFSSKVQTTTSDVRGISRSVQGIDSVAVRMARIICQRCLFQP